MGYSDSLNATLGITKSINDHNRDLADLEARKITNKGNKYKLEQGLALDQLAAKHRDASGRLTPGFYNAARSMGLGDEALETFEAREEARYKRASNVAGDVQGISAMGADPSKVTGATPSPIEVTPEAPAPRKSADEYIGKMFGFGKADNRSNLQKRANPLSNTPPGPVDVTVNHGTGTDLPTRPTGSGVAQTDEQRAAVGNAPGLASPGRMGEKPPTMGGQPDPFAPDEVQIRGQSPTGSKTGMFELPAPEIEDRQFKIPEESWLTEVARSTKPIVAGEDGSAGGAGNVPSVDPSLFSWEPQNDGSNAYTQYKNAQDSWLKSSGFQSTEDYLRKTYDSVLSSNMPTAPNPGLLALGREGVAKYKGEQASYLAGLNQAKGKAENAVLEARGKLTETAQKYGVSTIDQRKTEVPGNKILRDSSKRDTYSSLDGNFLTIKQGRDHLKKAGEDYAELLLAAPTVIRGYTTATSPGMQLSEGNLHESAMKLYPEFGSDSEMMTKFASALYMAVVKDDSSLLESYAKKAEQMTGKSLKKRLEAMSIESEDLNKRAIRNYIIDAPREQAEEQPVERPSLPTTPMPESTGPSTGTGTEAADYRSPALKEWEAYIRRTSGVDNPKTPKTPNKPKKTFKKEVF